MKKVTLKKVWTWLGFMTFYVTWPGIWLVVRGTVRTRVVIWSEDKVLLVKDWLSPGKYSLPGGGLRHGEEPAMCAAREVYEETGLRINPTQLDLIVQTPAKENGINYSAAIFLCKISKIPKTTLKTSEFSTAEWLDIRLAKSSKAVSAYTGQVLRYIKAIEG